MLTRNLQSTVLIILVNIATAILGAILIFRPDLGVLLIRYYVGIILIMKSFTALWTYFSEYDFKKWGKLAEGLGLLILSAAFFFNTGFSIISFSIVLFLWMLIDGLIKLMIAFQYKDSHLKNWWYMLVFACISFGFALDVVLTLGGGINFMIMISGLYIIVQAAISIFDAVFRGESFARMGKRYRLNILYMQGRLFKTSFLPQKVMEKFEQQTQQENDLSGFLEEGTVVKPVDTEGYTTIEVYIHSWEVSATMMGHSDFSIDGTIYSYGNYDAHSHKLGGAVSDGCLAITEQDPYIQYCLNNEKKILIDYTLRLTFEQKEKLKTYLLTMQQKLVPWFPPGVEDPKADDAASLVFKTILMHFYKFKDNKFRYYFVLNTNCIRFVEQALKVIDIDDPNITGVLTPGDYIAFFEERLADKNDTQVIARKVLYAEDVYKQHA